jgi:hypothetical protein
MFTDDAATSQGGLLTGSACGYCCHILKGTVVRHSILECQYRQSMYCPVCAAYGHAPADCPNKITWAIRQGLPTANLENLVLEVRGGEDGVKEVLKEYGLKPGTRIQENRKLLRNLANSLQPPRLIKFV